MAGTCQNRIQSVTPKLNSYVEMCVRAPYLGHTFLAGGMDTHDKLNSSLDRLHAQLHALEAGLHLGAGHFHPDSKKKEVRLAIKIGEIMKNELLRPVNSKDKKWPAFILIESFSCEPLNFGKIKYFVVTESEALKRDMHSSNGKRVDHMKNEVLWAIDKCEHLNEFFAPIKTMISNFKDMKTSQDQADLKRLLLQLKTNNVPDYVVWGVLENLLHAKHQRTPPYKDPSLNFAYIFNQVYPGYLRL